MTNSNTEKQKLGLLDMTNKSLRNAYKNSIYYENGKEKVVFSTNDYYREIERRTQNKHSIAMLALTCSIAALTLIATIATVLSFASLCGR